MKKLIITLVIIALVAALCAAVLVPEQSVENIPAEPEIAETAATAIKAPNMESPVMQDLNNEASTYDYSSPANNPAAAEIIAEKEVASTVSEAPPSQPAPTSVSQPSETTQPTATPNPYLDQSLFGKSKTVNGVEYVYIPGFGWVEGSPQPGVCTIVYDMYENGNKVGIMGGDDEVTGEYAAPKATPECVYYTPEELENGRPPMPTTSNKPVVPDDYSPSIDIRDVDFN